MKPFAPSPLLSILLILLAWGNIAPSSEGSVTLADARHEVVFIDTGVADWRILANGVRPGVEVVLLDANGDGLAQMAAWVQKHSGYNAIHIVSHSNQGAIELGSLTLDLAATMERSADLASLGSSLTADGDLLIYGCQVADGAGGALISALADATGADVAASLDATGGSVVEGNWTLELATGTIEAALPFDTAVADQYDHLLDAPLKDTIMTFGTSSKPILTKLVVDATTDELYADGSAHKTPSGLYLTTDTDDTNGVVINYNANNPSSSKLSGSGDAALFVGSTKYATLSSVTFNSVDGTAFKLVSFDFGFYLSSTGTSKVNVTFTAIDGATVGGSVTMNLQERTANPIDLSTNTNFQHITAFKVSFDTPVVRTEYDNMLLTNAVASNVAPTFSGTDASTTTVTVNADSDGNNFAGLVTVSDTDSGQTLTWSQDLAPSHGTISLNSGALTASTGGASLLPADALTYTPNAGYAGTDTFRIKVSDGTSQITKTITVTVTPGAPSTPDLLAASDTGSSNTDNVTNASYLRFGGTGAAHGTGSTDGSDVIVFVDVNANGAFDSGDNFTTIAADTSGNWSDSGSGVDVSSLVNGTYNVYAFDRSVIGSVTGPLSNALSITIDRTAPAFDVAPATGSVTTSGFTPSASLDEAGTIYYVVVADNATAPTVTQVKAGQDSTGNAALTSGSSSATTGNFDSSFNAIITLSASTAYDVYFVATDSAGNDQTGVAKVDVTTGTANTAPTLGGIFTTNGTVNDNATTMPFSQVTVSDANSGDNVSVHITFTGANGTLSGTGLTPNGSGNYTLNATDPATVTSRLQALVFTPTANQVAPGNTVQTTFTLTPNDGTTDGAADSTTVITATSINDAPVITSANTASVSTFDGA
ncbi:MAG: DUF4347 domain-containing protein, partial [Candidatus Competibacteraceae bacterium]|nr:DUF4347 domain-containing protein [Candidatus Competibacteraceae bacterium]